MKSFIKEYGNEIKRLRKSANLSQIQLSSLSNVERSQISKIEQGLVDGVTMFTIEKIFYALGYTLRPEKKSIEELNIHPFVKWAGGKTQLLEVIKTHLPSHFNRYYEPFVGGGALLFDLKPSSFSINDSNEELMLTFKCFEDDVLYQKLIEELKIHENNHSEEYYYKIRELDKDKEFNNLPIYVRAGRLIYLNKSCFNGLYRVNSKGYFNVPSGKKKKVKCFDEENFANLRLFFKNSKHSINCEDFETAVKNAKEGDFVYFDPPYDTWETKESFTAYDKNSFGKEEQLRLANLFKKLSEKGVYVMASNHNTPYVNEIYKGFNIHIVNAKRMINSKANGRGNVEEVLITNYE